MPFEVFTREVVRTTEPRITITNLGRFAINNSATAMLKSAAGLGFGAEMRVLLLWDKSTNRIGIQPAKKTDPRSYPLKAYGPKGRSGTSFSAVTFLKFINYDFSGTQRYSVEMNNDGMLIFTVPKERIGGGVPMEPPVATMVSTKTRRRM